MKGAESTIGERGLNIFLPFLGLNNVHRSLLNPEGFPCFFPAFTDVILNISFDSAALAEAFYVLGCEVEAVVNLSFAFFGCYVPIIVFGVISGVIIEQILGLFPFFGFGGSLLIHK